MTQGKTLLRYRARVAPLCALLVGIANSGCGLYRHMAIRAVEPVLENIQKSIYRQSDLQLAKDGLPAFLLLIDGLIESSPNDPNLLMAGARAYSAYAMAFVEDEDTERATRLYAKAKDYAIRLLCRNERFAKVYDKPLDEFAPALSTFRKKDVPTLFWAASCWASWVNSNIDSVEAMADLPKIEALIRRVAELDDTYYYGGPHLFLGIYYAARTKQIGGDPVKAKNHFDRALQLAGDRFLLTRVYFAKYYARQILDRDLYVKTLKEVLNANTDADPDLTLINTVAKQRARKLLDMADEYF